MEDPNKSSPPNPPPTRNEIDGNIFFTCPKCGKRLQAKGASPLARVLGKSKQDVSWLECQCGYRHYN